MTSSGFVITKIVSNYSLYINSPLFLTTFSHYMDFRYNLIGTFHTYHPRVRGESFRSNTSNKERSTRGEKVRRKFHKCMEFFCWMRFVFLWRFERRWRRGSFEVQTSSEKMGSQWISSVGHWLLCQWGFITLLRRPYMVWVYSPWMA